MPPGGGLERTPVNPGYGRELKVFVTREEQLFNSCLHSVRCIATEDSVVLDFEIKCGKMATGATSTARGETLRPQRQLPNTFHHSQKFTPTMT